MLLYGVVPLKMTVSGDGWVESGDVQFQVRVQFGPLTAMKMIVLLPLPKSSS